MPPLVVMVSSPVYGMEDLLNQIYALLTGYGYTVWMSHKGTLPVDSRKSNFENCLNAVDACDVFLGILTGRYGSGREPGALSITHQEIRRAVALDKLRYFLVHHDVTVARQLLRQFRYDREGQRLPFTLQKTAVLDDVLVLDLYEEVIQNDSPLAARRGNWVQPYYGTPELLHFIESQFMDAARVRAMLEGERS